MKPITLTLHPISALAGAGLFGLVLLTASSFQAAGPKSPVPFVPEWLRQPDPCAILVVKEAVPFVVPQGKRFVVTGLGSTSPTIESVTLLVDGIPEMTTHTETSTTIRETPPWFSVVAGSTISPIGGDPYDSSDVRVFGYLIDG